MMGPRWLAIAYEEMRRGVKEISGPQHSERIQLYHGATSLQATADEVPWCSSFACWAMEHANVESPASARSRDWLDWGVGVSPVHPPIGAVIVLSRGGPGQPGPEVRDAPGHVGFFFSHGEPGRLVLLGGNQGDSVSLGNFPVHRLLGVRWAK